MPSTTVVAGLINLFSICHKEDFGRILECVWIVDHYRGSWHTSTGEKSIICASFQWLNPALRNNSCHKNELESIHTKYTYMHLFFKTATCKLHIYRFAYHSFAHEITFPYELPLCLLHWLNKPLLFRVPELNILLIPGPESRWLFSRSYLVMTTKLLDSSHVIAIMSLIDIIFQ